MTYRAAQVKNGLANSRPAATGSGMIYTCNDIPALYVDDPATKAWKQYASEYMPAPPAFSNFTTVGSVGISQYADSIRITKQNNDNTIGGAFASSGTLGTTQSWSITMVSQVQMFFNQTFPSFGVAVSNGVVSGTSQSWAACVYQNANIGFHGINDTLGTGTRNTSAFNELAGYLSPFILGTGRLHFRLLNDGGSCLHMQIGPDNFHWQDIFSFSTPSGLNHYGFVLGTDSGSTVSYGQAIVHQCTQTSPVQFTVTNVTTASPCVFTIGAHSILVGELVSIHGVNGTGTTPNTGNGSVNGIGANSTQVTAVTATTITTGQNYTGTYSSGGTVTLLTR